MVVRNKETEMYISINNVFRSSSDSMFAALGCIINNAIATHAKDNYFTALLFANFLVRLLELNEEAGYNFLCEPKTKALRKMFIDQDYNILEKYKKVEFIRIF